jgi:hypothetical protein
VDLVAEAKRQLRLLDEAHAFTAPFDPRPRALQSGLDAAPREYLCPVLAYPSWLKGSGKRDIVTAEFVIDSTGLVVERSIRVVSQADEDLTAAALDRLAQCGYVPGRKGGRPVPVRVVQSWRVAERP